jgi:hypothetical protein
MRLHVYALVFPLLRFLSHWISRISNGDSADLCDNWQLEKNAQKALFD